jgi:hypothetical protein
MQHMGAEYISCLSFEDSAFCREIYRVLSGYCGRPIDEIGDIDISFALNGGSPLDSRSTELTFVPKTPEKGGT